MSAIVSYPGSLYLGGWAEYLAFLFKIVITRLIIPVRIGCLDIAQILFRRMAISHGRAMRGRLSFTTGSYGEYD